MTHNDLTAVCSLLHRVCLVPDLRFLRHLLFNFPGPVLRLTMWTNWTNIRLMKTVNVHKAKTKFSSLLARLETNGQPIVICRNGRPVADLVPHRRANRVKPHPALAKVKIGYNPVEPLSADEWPKAAR